GQEKIVCYMDCNEKYNREPPRPITTTVLPSEAITTGSPKTTGPATAVTPTTTIFVSETTAPNISVTPTTTVFVSETTAPTTAVVPTTTAFISETTATTTGTTTVATPTGATTTVSNGGATQTIASVALLILTAGAILH
ncbi:hypothetical protein L0F63_001180, partial [Massospora cicadina]